MKINSMAKSGDVVVIYGRTKLDRDVVRFTDATSLVSYFRERDDPKGEIASNAEYMKFVGDRLRTVYEMEGVLPSHNEDAFVAGLFRLGLCSLTTLN